MLQQLTERGCVSACRAARRPTIASLLVLMLAGIPALVAAPACAQDKQPGSNSNTQTQAAQKPGTASAPEENALGLDFISDAPASSLAVKLLKSHFQSELKKNLRADDAKIELELTVRQVTNTQNKPSPAKNTAAKTPRAFQEIRSASADGGLIDTGKYPASLPLLQGPWKAPFMGLDAASLSRILTLVIDQVPEIRQSFLSKNKVLLAMNASSEFVLLTKLELKDLGGLKGRKIGVPASAADWLGNTGAIAMPVDAQSYRQGLATDNLDGVIVPVAQIIPLKLLEVAPHVIRAGLGSMPGTALTINKNLWDDLKQAQRDALSSAALMYQLELAKAAKAQAGSLLSQIGTAGGKVSVLSDQARRQWAAGLPNVPALWPAKLKKTGKPAVRFMQVYLQSAARYSAHIPRDWSK